MIKVILSDCRDKGYLFTKHISYLSLDYEYYFLYEKKSEISLNIKIKVIIKFSLL